MLGDNSYYQQNNAYRSKSTLDPIIPKDLNRNGASLGGQRQGTSSSNSQIANNYNFIVPGGPNNNGGNYYGNG